MNFSHILTAISGAALVVVAYGMWFHELTLIAVGAVFFFAAIWSAEAWS